MLARMPLAEAVLTVWRFVCDEQRLEAVFRQHRGRSYEQSISFGSMVQLVADALLEHEGSGRQSFERAHEAGDLEATPRAAYAKLGRLPIALSVGWFGEMAAAVGELFPAEGRRDPPPSLAGFRVITIDGKTIKRVAKRLKPLRKTSGGVIGGKALVATERSTGLAIAMSADPDGEAHDARLVPELLPRVRERMSGPRLWLADRAFCDPLQISRFAAESDAYVLRYNAKNKFTRDEEHPVVESADSEGRQVIDEVGVIGGPSNKHRRAVRRITLVREDGDDVSIVTELFDAPADELLGLYRERWGIERMFQQVTEVFGLKKLIGGRPEATLFQFAFCLLLYNQMRLVQAYVEKHQAWEPEMVSIEQLFVDVRRELIAWAVVVGAADLPQRSASETRRRLDRLLRTQWSDRWVKAIHAKQPKKPPGPKSKTHTSAYRALLQAKT